MYGSNNMIFFYTNKKKTNPIIGRIILNGNQPCANPEEYCWEKLDEYEGNGTSSCINDYEGNLYDDTYSQFGDISYNILYKENLLSKDYDVFNKKELESRKLYLFKNRFIGIDKECLNKSNFNNMSELDYPQTDILLHLSLSILMNLVFIFVLIISDCNIKTDDSYYEFCIKSIEVLYGLTNFIVFIVYIIDFIDFGLRRTDFNCSDDIINHKVYLLNNQILKVRIGLMFYIILSVIFYILAICKFFYARKYKRNIFNVFFSKITGKCDNNNSDKLIDDNDSETNDHNNQDYHYSLN